MEVSIRAYETYRESDILPLYESVGWRTYTARPAMVEAAYKGSRKVLAAWEGERLVGIIRAVGDGHSILYIQDIIVLPEFQRRGIGRRLITAMDEAFPAVYQKVLLTDDRPETVGFYKSCGFTPSAQFGSMAFVKMQAYTNQE